MSKKTKFRINPSEKENKPFKLEADATPISISLKYWHSGSQCISKWQRAELEKLRKFIDKTQGMTVKQITTDPGLYWKAHKGPPKGSGFSRPAALSQEITLCELRLSSASRVHGVFLGDTFFLVWLDRTHDVFPER